MISTKPITCKHCAAVNKHHSFQCHLVRKPIKRKESAPKPVPRKPIKQVSDKRKKEMSKYTKLCTAFKILNPVCQGQLEGCTYSTTEVHHAAGRMGSLLTNVDHFVPLCASCHRHVELNPEMAKEKGLSKSRLNIDANN
jgi:hypothetical protein